jgi:hypothetical protein
VKSIAGVGAGVPLHQHGEQQDTDSIDQRGDSWREDGGGRGQALHWHTPVRSAYVAFGSQGFTRSVDVLRSFRHREGRPVRHVSSIVVRGNHVSLLARHALQLGQPVEHERDPTALCVTSRTHQRQGLAIGVDIVVVVERRCEWLDHQPLRQHANA